MHECIPYAPHSFCYVFLMCLANYRTYRVIMIREPALDKSRRKKTSNDLIMCNAGSYRYNDFRISDVEARAKSLQDRVYEQRVITHSFESLRRYLENL